MSARTIGELFPGVLERAARLRPVQEAINAIGSSSGRKTAIMGAWERMAITDEEAELLIQAYGLETA